MKTTNHDMMNRFFPAKGNQAPDPRHMRKMMRGKQDDRWKVDQEDNDMDDKMERRSRAT